MRGLSLRVEGVRTLEEGAGGLGIAVFRSPQGGEPTKGCGGFLFCIPLVRADGGAQALFAGLALAGLDQSFGGGREKRGIRSCSLGKRRSASRNKRGARLRVSGS